MTDELWKNMSAIILAIGVVITAVGTLLNLVWQHRATQALAVLKVQTDGMSKTIEKLAGEAGEKRGADAQRLSNVEKVQAVDAQTEKIVAQVTEVVKTNGNSEHK